MIDYFNEHDLCFSLTDFLTRVSNTNRTDVPLVRIKPDSVPADLQSTSVSRSLHKMILNIRQARPTDFNSNEIFIKGICLNFDKQSSVMGYPHEIA